MADVIEKFKKIAGADKGAKRAPNSLDRQYYIVKGGGQTFLEPLSILS